MDLSVFNFLIGTNPNASAAENLFPDATQDAVSGTSAQKLRTSDAFLQALKQARTGKPEKDAGILYNMVSAQADAASSLKDLKKAGVSKENVKVVKLHIKRTRASETLRKADEQKAAAATNAAPQDGQKIPTRENIAATSRETTGRPEQNETKEAVETFESDQIALSVQASEAQENRDLPVEELTAADILISSALQTVFRPLGRTQHPVVVEQPANSDTSAAPVSLQKETDPVFQPRETVAADTRKPVPEGVEKHQNIPVFNQNNSDKTKQGDIFILPENTVPAPVLKERPNERIVVKETTPDEHGQNDTVVEKSLVRTVEKAPVHTEKETKIETARVSKPSEMTETEDSDAFGTDCSAREAHRQAADLARKLPAETKIAISVETQQPVAQTFVRPHSETSRSERAKADMKTTNDDRPAVTLPDDPVEKPAQETASLQSGKTETFRHAPEQTEQTGQPDGFTILAPVQNKVVSDSPVATETASGGVSETGATTPAQASAAAILPEHELKGKAVSGSVPVRKHVPVNELVDRIKVNIKKAVKEGLDKIDIVLKPKELGTIKIHLEIGKDGTMKAVLNTARAETLDLLQSDLSVLKQALADSGFDLNDQSFSFNYRGERYNDGQKQPQNGQNQFSAEQADDEAAEETAGSLSISGRYALNIRV